MNKISCAVLAAGMVLTIIISNIGSVVRDGRELDELRNSVLRLHILADSDSKSDQQLKLMVRDTLLEHSDEIFGNADSLETAEKNAQENLGLIRELAEETLRKNGCTDSVSAELTDMHFDKRIYGDITMPAGEYRALRVTIGSAQGHNWWCVMYPPLCIPAACEYTDDSEDEESATESAVTGEITDDKETGEEFFDENQQDILYHPEKYEIRFALWDKLKSWFRN